MAAFPLLVEGLTEAGNAEVTSVCMWKKFDSEFALRTFCELLRETGLLWLVFSMLDRLISATLTVGWSLGNCGAALTLWIIGTGVEARHRWVTGSQL
jgi:hypothetical protein